MLIGHTRIFLSKIQPMNNHTGSPINSLRISRDQVCYEGVWESGGLQPSERTIVGDGSGRRHSRYRALEPRAACLGHGRPMATGGDLAEADAGIPCRQGDIHGTGGVGGSGLCIFYLLTLLFDVVWKASGETPSSGAGGGSDKTESCPVGRRIFSFVFCRSASFPVSDSARYVSPYNLSKLHILFSITSFQAFCVSLTCEATRIHRPIEYRPRLSLPFCPFLSQNEYWYQAGVHSSSRRVQLLHGAQGLQHRALVR